MYVIYTLTITLTVLGSISKAQISAPEAIQDRSLTRAEPRIFSLFKYSPFNLFGFGKKKQRPRQTVIIHRRPQYPKYTPPHHGYQEEHHEPHHEPHYSHDQEYPEHHHHEPHYTHEHEHHSHDHGGHHPEGGYGPPKPSDVTHEDHEVSHYHKEEPQHHGHDNNHYSHGDGYDSHPPSHHYEPNHSHKPFHAENSHSQESYEPELAYSPDIHSSGQVHSEPTHGGYEEPSHHPSYGHPKDHDIFESHEQIEGGFTPMKPHGIYGPPKHPSSSKEVNLYAGASSKENHHDIKDSIYTEPKKPQPVPLISKDATYSKTDSFKEPHGSSESGYNSHEISNFEHIQPVSNYSPNNIHKQSISNDQYVPPKNQEYEPPKSQDYIPPKIQEYSPPKSQGYLPPDNPYSPPKSQNFSPESEIYLPPKSTEYTPPKISENSLNKGNSPLPIRYSSPDDIPDHPPKHQSSPKKPPKKFSQSSVIKGNLQNSFRSGGRVKNHKKSLGGGGSDGSVESVDKLYPTIYRRPSGFMSFNMEDKNQKRNTQKRRVQSSNASSIKVSNPKTSAEKKISYTPSFVTGSRGATISKEKVPPKIHFTGLGSQPKNKKVTRPQVPKRPQNPRAGFRNTKKGSRGDQPVKPKIKSIMPTFEEASKNQQKNPGRAPFEKFLTTDEWSDKLP